MSTYLRRHIALPTDHGAWVFILSPLLIGIFTSAVWTRATTFLVVAVMAAFLIRQPITIATKTYSGRRPRRDLPAARFWILVYGSLILIATLSLIWLGYAYILILAIPGIPVFIWHLYLVSKRQERRQAGVEIVGSGVLALSAPAVYWVGVGSADTTGWWLFLLIWLQSAASIVYAYLRLAQRDLIKIPTVRARFIMARRALLYTSFNLLFSALLAWNTLPALIWLPFGIQWLESLWGSYFPAIGVKPTRIGLRQLIVSTIFTLTFILSWHLSG